MAITALAISSNLEYNRFGIGDPLAFVITVTGTPTTGGEDIIIELRRVGNDSVSLTKTINTKVAGTINSSFDIYQTENVKSSYSKPMVNGVEAASGEYYLYCYLDKDHTKYGKDANNLFCDIISIKGMREKYSMGIIPSFGYDSAILQAINDSYAWFERELECPLWNRKVAPFDITQSDWNASYDRWMDAPTYYPQDMIRAIIKLPLKPINSLDRIRGMIGTVCILDFKISGFVAKSRGGSVYWMPYGTTEAVQLNTLSYQFLLYPTTGGVIPNFWKFYYQAGWSERHGWNYDANLRGMLASKAKLEFFRNEYLGGSLSMDGLSESVNEESLAKIVDNKLERFRVQEFGLPVAAV